MFGRKFKKIFVFIFLILLVNHYYQSEETRSYLSEILDNVPYTEDIYCYFIKFYEIHLATYVTKCKLFTNEYYNILDSKFDEIPGSQNVKYFIENVYSDIKPELLIFFAYVDQLMVRIYKKYIWKGYVYSRIYIYTEALPYIKKHVYNVTYVYIPTLYNYIISSSNHICCVKIPLFFDSLFTRYLLSTKSYYTYSVSPMIQPYVNIFCSKSKPLVAPVYKLLARLASVAYKYGSIYVINYPMKYYYRAYNYLHYFFTAYAVEYYEHLVSLYYEFLTSDPLDEEIARLYNLLDAYASVFTTGITATITTTSTIYSRQNNVEFQTSHPLNDFVDKAVNLGSSKSSLNTVDKQISVWESLIVDTCDSVLTDFDAEFVDYQKKYINDGFKDLLEVNIRNLNQYINEGYNEIQTYIKDIDTADIYISNENFIINEFLLKEPKIKKHNKDLKFFKNVYPDSKTDPNGVTYNEYLQLIDEIDYLNDLLYNKTMIQKSRDDINFPDREFFLDNVLEGKNIDVSFGNVEYPETVEVNEFQLLTPGQYLVTSDILNRVTISNANRNIVTKIERKLVRDAFTKIRSTIEDKALILKNIIENGFYEILEEYNSIKFRHLDMFEDFCDIVLEEWDRRFLEHLETEEESKESFLFDIEYIDPKEVADDDTLLLSESNDSGTSEMVEFYKSKKNLINSKLNKQKRKINHSQNWKSFRKFYRIKQILLETRDTLNNMPPNLEETHKIAQSIDKTVYLLLSESNQYLDLLRAQANLAFQFREEAEFKERVRRYSKFNEDSLEDLEEKKLKEEILKAEHKKFMNRLVDGTDDEEIINEKLHRFKKEDEIIEELENADNIEYYYDAAEEIASDDIASFTVDTALKIISSKDCTSSAGTSMQSVSIATSTSTVTSTSIIQRTSGSFSVSKPRSSSEVAAGSSVEQSSTPLALETDSPIEEVQYENFNIISSSKTLVSKSIPKISSKKVKSSANSELTEGAISKIISSTFIQSVSTSDADLSKTLGPNVGDKEEIFEKSSEASTVPLHTSSIAKLI